MFFANHARSVTLLVRGDALEKSMSQYLIDQVREKSNIKVALRCEVARVHGDDHLTAIDIVDRAGNAARRETCGGLFVFIGADAETGWLPPEIARDERGYVLTGSDLLRAGRWSHDRDPPISSKPAFRGSSPAGDVRFGPVSTSHPRSAKAAWPSPSCTSTCRNRRHRRRVSARFPESPRRVAVT